MDMEKVGEYAFLAGVIIAVLAGVAAGAVVAYAAWITLALVVLGIIVGLLNVSEKETQPFLVAAIALMVTGTIAAFVSIDTVLPPLGSIVAGVVGQIAVFVAPAAVIVALKAVWDLGK